MCSVRAAGHGGQVLLTKATSDLVTGRLGDGFGLRRLGEFRLRDLAVPELIYQLDHADLPVEFPPIRTLANRTGNVPLQVSSFIGRAQEVEETAAALGQARLVTLTGPGGIGKTRLAMAVGERLRNRFGAGMVFVPLAAVSDSTLVLADIARAVGADLAGAGSPLQALAEWFGDDRWLLILDNLEQVVSAAGDLGELLGRCRGVAILTTSRTVLGLAAEREYPVPPLPCRPSRPRSRQRNWSLRRRWRCLWTAPGRCVRLRADPRQRVSGGGDLPAAGGPAAGDRAGGRPHPAAGSYRAARPAGRSLDALGTGAVDLPERQRTLRATVECSVGLLDDDERSLLETVAVFTDGWTIGAAAQVAGLDEDRALELLDALARHNLVQPDISSDTFRCRIWRPSEHSWPSG